MRNHLISERLIACLLATGIAVGAGLGWFFYEKANEVRVVKEADFHLDGAGFKSNLDVCDIADGAALIKGWAYIPGLEKNTVVRVFVESKSGQLLEIRSRVETRTDVNDAFQVDYHNAKLGFAASAANDALDIALAARVLLIKKDQEGNQYGEVYWCD